MINKSAQGSITYNKTIHAFDVCSGDMKLSKIVVSRRSIINLIQISPALYEQITENKMYVADQRKETRCSPRTEVVL